MTEKWTICPKQITEDESKPKQTNNPRLKGKKKKQDASESTRDSCQCGIFRWPKNRDKKKIQRQTKWVINGHTSYCNVTTSERFVYSNYRICELQKFLKTHVPFPRSSWILKDRADVLITAHWLLFWPGSFISILKPGSMMDFPISYTPWAIINCPLIPSVWNHERSEAGRAGPRPRINHISDKIYENNLVTNSMKWWSWSWGKLQSGLLVLSGCGQANSV